MTDALMRNRNGNNVSYGDRRPVPWTPFENLLGFDPFQNMRSNWGFEYDVTRTDHGYQVDVPVPGYKSENIEITAKDGIITVSGKTDRRSFSRSFTIPEDVDQDRIEAQVADGMLVINLERRPEAQPKRIQVK